MYLHFLQLLFITSVNQCGFTYYSRVNYCTIFNTNKTLSKYFYSVSSYFVGKVKDIPIIEGAYYSGDLEIRLPAVPYVFDWSCV